MITGQSDFFSLEPGQTTFIADVLPGELDPIPVEIDATAPADLLTEGTSTFLQVTATLPDGSQEDVTSPRPSPSRCSTRVWWPVWSSSVGPRNP